MAAIRSGPPGSRTRRSSTKDNVKNLKILWKLKLDNEPQEMHSLFPPLIVEKVKTARGSKEIAVVAGISDNLYAIDVETGKLLWKKHFEYPTPRAARQTRRSAVPSGPDRDSGDRRRRTHRASGPSTRWPATASCIR